MGRYISGDVEGKCWFAVQSSDFMDRFGSTFHEPNYICYYYDESNLPEMNRELKAIEDSMGEQMQKYDEFFGEGRGYNKKMIIEAGLDPKHLNDYADYTFAQKVKAYILEHRECSFEVER